MKSFKAVFNLS